MYMFGGLFGGDDNSSKDMDGQLAVYPKLAMDDSVKYESLSDYIQKWAQLFETGNIKLTTPVQLIPSPSSTEVIDENIEGAEAHDDVVSKSGVQFVFKNTSTGYMSKKEEDSMGGGGSYKKADAPARKESDKKKDEKKQGGVEVLVEQLSTGEIRIRAQRCNMDEDTMIKEMSEETILKELKKAVDVWKKEV